MSVYQETTARKEKARAMVYVRLWEHGPAVVLGARRATAFSEREIRIRMTRLPRFGATALLVTLLTVGTRVASQAGEARAPSSADYAAKLVAAYPAFLDRVDGNRIVWRDGTLTPFDDGAGEKAFERWLSAPDLEDMFRFPYPAGADVAPPAIDVDPGRARNAAFFDAMYGDCRKGEVAKSLETIVWLPTKAPQKLQVTRINGVSARLAAVSKELDALPATFDKFLAPSSGTYNCRVIAGTDRLSAHGSGIAIDIAAGQSDYWRWAKGDHGGRRGDLGGPVPYRNRVPIEIVRIFEKHGFIWGGRWYHYDTMHFEYRPELLPALAPLPDAAASSVAPAAR